MANTANMGPPPSPKEPRRSGRRTAPSASTSSKSPAGSPSSEQGSKPKENSHRPPPSSNGSNRSKRSKQEDIEDALEETHKNGVNGNGSTRTKRKGKEKEKPTGLVIEIPGAEDSKPDISGVGGADGEEEEEEGGITRCICGEDETEAEFMAMCEMCKTWQHGTCMGYSAVEDIPLLYYCELCRPDLYVELLKKHAKRARQSSATSHHTATFAGNASRSSRSHSPAHHIKPPKRRNTMNSRDAAYEESFQALIEATAAEAAAANEAQQNHPTSPAANEAEVEAADEVTTEVVSGGRKKRKRAEDDAVSTKRTRSASTTSDRPSLANLNIGRDGTPVNGAPSKAPPVSSAPAKSANSRNKRTASRKSQAQTQDVLSLDGEEAGSVTSRKPAANSRSRATATNDTSRRAQNSVANSHGPSASSHPPASTAAASRAYHQAHVYSQSQHPLFTSWNLPDYLAHLEHMLPTNIPRPLEVRGSGVDANGRESLERTTERGVKVKWPSKRMSVGDMNKRVRALVEWVGREQASALDRSRRREAIERAFKEAQENGVESGAGSGDHPGDPEIAMVVDGAPVPASPAQEKRAPLADSLSASAHNPNPPDSGPETMKMMEELMEELIGFQERFGPGAKVKERDRRTVTS